MTSSFTSVLPSARRLMASLRDIGYDLPAAVADIVDNSIDAGASQVHISIHDDGSESWVRVADDGIGMTGKALDEAMRYGSSGRYDDRSLGHFGLGLKTASLSQCRRLTVASRTTKSNRVSVRRWDLDHVERRDAWELESPSGRDRPPHLITPLSDRAGTVVLWEKLDRILSFRRPSSAVTSRALVAMAADISAHLGMVFHRFISGESSEGRRPVTVLVNGTVVPAWDPFARGEKSTQKLPPQLVRLEQDDDEDPLELEVQPFVLPPQTKFSSPQAHQLAAGPNRWNRQQGFYFYRRDRLIQSGGWNRLRTMDEHAKLARIAVDLPAGHEHHFAINVAKMSLTLPEAVRPALRAIAASTAQAAQRQYRDQVPAQHEQERHSSYAAQQLTTATRTDAQGPSLTGDWSLISATVEEVLDDRPDIRDKLLLRLANAFAVA
jgi:anti-sigma regulatory factor (Ser/Thr protein kinase)